MRKIALSHGNFTLTDRVALFFEKQITKFGNGAKIDAPKEFIGKNVIVLILDQKVASARAGAVPRRKRA